MSSREGIALNKAEFYEYVPKGVKAGRCYDGFLSYMQEHSLSAHQELDTVIGRPGGKAIILYAMFNPKAY